MSSGFPVLIQVLGQKWPNFDPKLELGLEILNSFLTKINPFFPKLELGLEILNPIFEHRPILSPIFPRPSEGSLNTPTPIHQTQFNSFE